MSQSVPTCSNPGVGGNTKTPTQLKKKKTVNPAKRWCFTLNNYTEDEFCSICSKIRDICSIGIIGKEIGEQGTPHLQGYFEFRKKSRPMTHFHNNRIHWEKCKGNREQNITYCSKDKDVWLHNIDKPFVQEIDKLYYWEQDIIDIICEEPDDRTINWYWDQDGCAGKTTFCKYIFTHYDGVVVLSGKASDMKNCIVQYKETNGFLPKIVLIDIPRSTNTEFLSYQGIEEIKNMFFYSGKYEGGMVCGKPPHLFIFANESPKLSKCSLDRWNINRVDN